MAQAGKVIARWRHMGARLSLGGLLMVVSLVSAQSATAEPIGNYAKFAYCPFANPAALKCLYVTTAEGEVSLGSRKVPVVNPVVLQGAYTAANKSDFGKFIAATNGVTLSKVSQPVPGGLAGIVSPEGSSPLVRAMIAFFFENDLTRVSATLELAKPANEIRFSENNLGGELGTALKLPIKIHLESPLLGESCYVGSATAPIIWNLTSGTTSPPKPTKPIAGSAGKIEFLEEGRIIETKDSSFVDNTWAVPVATGCGGPLSFLINPIVNTSAGLPSAAGKNVVTLKSSAFLTSAVAVKKNDAESP
jgi:hypothetical protein